ncbi:hypothetical protein MalM25_03670 [Planctomycetes bacterium MalM25]|nr:hypothetical protein MalM25_03670 [Planctomycetes bacterium MalM25]
MPLLRFFVALILAASSGWCFAHKPSDSYLRIDGTAAAFAAEWDIAVRDLELLVGLDDDQDGKITWGELKQKQEAVAAHALSHLTVRSGRTPLPIEATDLRVTRHSDGAYAVLSLSGEPTSAAEPLELDYDLLFALDPTHRGLVLLRGDAGVSTTILSPEQPTVRLDPREITAFHTLAEYVREGVWHIWIGFDHILFLVTLLLPAVLVWREGSWSGAESFAAASRRVFRIVTMFTVAHSITLWLSVMEYVALPSQWVEASIALSIIVTALANLYPKLPVSGWKVAFLFGLIHGFGFANVLIDLGLTSGSLALALFGFNVGVELGQLAIVLAFLPVAYPLRGTWCYQTIVLRGGSVVVALVAAIWFYERTLNAEILGI